MTLAEPRADIRLIGFEEFGNSDVFTAKALEFRLQISGMSSAATP
jgi:hypothetical protein